MDCYNYETANEILKNRDKKKIAHQTWLKRIDENEIAVVYHSTPVVRYFKDGEIRIHDGGWATVTTKRRINDFQKIGYLYQQNFEWFFHYIPGATVKFENGMTLFHLTTEEFEALKT